MSRKLGLMLKVFSATALLNGASVMAVAEETGAANAIPPDVRSLRIQLPADGLNGKGAVKALGSRLTDVAKNHGMTGRDLKKRLEADPSLKVSREGGLYYVHQVPEELSSLNSMASAPVGASGRAAVPPGDVLKLHSKPGSNKVIVLNFIGTTVTGTVWNSVTGKASLQALPFDLDGKPDKLTEEEKSFILHVWQTVAEDYAPFDVDVTTELLPQDRISRSGESDQTYGITVLITRANGVSAPGIGGTSYATSFNRTSDYYKPAWVYHDSLGSSKKVAEAASHEIGHSLGLSHDGTANEEYFRGHGTATTGWAPIMGIGYDKPVVQFSKGEFKGAARNLEDDFAVIQKYGLGYRKDMACRASTSLSVADNQDVRLWSLRSDQLGGCVLLYVVGVIGFEVVAGGCRCGVSPG